MPLELDSNQPHQLQKNKIVRKVQTMIQEWILVWTSLLLYPTGMNLWPKLQAVSNVHRTAAVWSLPLATMKSGIF